MFPHELTPAQREAWEEWFREVGAKQNRENWDAALERAPVTLQHLTAFPRRQKD